MDKQPDRQADRQAQLDRIGAALRAAGTAADWPRLGELARALDGQLRALAARGPWTPGERAALQCLRQSHDSAAQCVAGAAQELQERMHLMRANEEGWLAYAMQSPIYSEPEHDASQGLPR